jgi:hypothetical protein
MNPNILSMFCQVVWHDTIGKFSDCKERNPAGMSIVLVELLAYVGDQISYYQNSVATEAYLGTARKRISIRRHARLLDYVIHDGCYAKAWLTISTEPGRPEVDADWKEQVDIHFHYKRASLTEIIGLTGTPIDSITGSSDGFKIVPISANEYRIHAGHYYVDGILCENEEDVNALQQEDLPTFQGTSYAVPTNYGTYFVYLDVWERQLKALDDGPIQDVTIMGGHTANLETIVWQVKVLQVGSNTETINCLSQYSSWTNKVTPSTGMLRARARPTQQTKDPCVMPPEAGYRGLGNQLYRVEISDPGEIGSNAVNPPPTFKWSRDNGSVVSKILAIDETNNKLTLNSTASDNNHSFTNKVWAEVSDDRRELWGIPGTFVKITDVDQNTLRFDRNFVKGDQITNANFPQEFNPKVRRWDSATGIDIGSVPSTNSGYIELENGVEIRFEEGRYYATGDYWLIRASTATAGIEWDDMEYQMQWGQLIVTGSDDESKLKEFLVNGFGADWATPQSVQFSFESPTESNNIIASSTTGTHSLSLRLNDDSTAATLTIDNEIVYTFLVLQQLHGNLILHGAIPQPLPPIGIKHHFARLAILTYTSSGIKVVDCRHLFPRAKRHAQGANTGLIRLTTHDKSPARYGPFLHYMADLKVPPVIILGYVGSSSKREYASKLNTAIVHSAEGQTHYPFGERLPSFKPEQVTPKTFKIMFAGVPNTYYVRWWAIPA